MSSQNIELSEEERAELSRWMRLAKISQRDGRGEGARVILLAAQGHSRKAIAQLTDLSLCRSRIGASASNPNGWRD